MIRIIPLLLCLNFHAFAPGESLAPLSDPANEGGWVLNADLSDEFSGTELNEEKWMVQGRDGQYRTNFKGRAPSHFDPANVRVEDGMLKLATKWDPEFPFPDTKDDSGNIYENLTVGGINSHAEFLYGYMEVRCKPANASISANVFTLGYESELDMFELMGNPKQEKKAHVAEKWKINIIDWSKPADEERTYNQMLPLGFRVADQHNVYGCEWNNDGVTFYLNGELFHEAPREAVGDNWCLNNPLRVWIDLETFIWQGIPEEQDLPVDYEIDYIRTWQKPDSNLLAPAFFGFEGPMIPGGEIVGQPIWEQRKHWFTPEREQHHFERTEARYVTGGRSLVFQSIGDMSADTATTFSPYGSVTLPAGQVECKLKVWIDEACQVGRFTIIREQPWTEQVFELRDLPRGEWVELSRVFNHESPSGEKDRLRIVVKKQDVPPGKNLFYLDDLSIRTIVAD